MRLLETFVRQCLFEQVRKQFDMSLPDDLRELASLFKSANHQLYVVGGAVRDALLGKHPKDYDVATEAQPDDVVKLLKTVPEYKVLEIGKAFGVVKVITPEGNEYEIATFRRDLSKGRRPDAVEFTSIDQDVMRRDLTINALFYDIDAHEIVDYVGGIDDIKNGIVRAVGDPKERFDEDRLRILRALRFAGRMGSKLDPTTDEAIKNDNSLAGVSPERIRDEFLKGILSARSTVQFLDMIERYDLWPQVLPGLVVDRVSLDTKNVPVLLAYLLWNNNPQQVAKRLNALKYTGDEVSQVSFLMMFKDLKVENAYRLKKLFMKSSKLKDGDLVEFASLKNVPHPDVVGAFIEYEPSVTGEELMARGLSGAELGREQERLETEKFRSLI